MLIFSVIEYHDCCIFISLFFFFDRSLSATKLNFIALLMRLRSSDLVGSYL